MNYNLKGVLVFLLGLIVFLGVGVYLGGWVMFIGGLVTLIDVFKAPETSGLAILWGVVKITFSGSISAFGLFIGGCIMGFSVIELMKPKKTKEELEKSRESLIQEMQERAKANFRYFHDDPNDT